MNERYDLYMGDCLEVMKEIPDGSIDLILADPPYGTIKGLGESEQAKEAGYRDCAWDVEIPIDKMFFDCSRILRQNGKAIFFSQEPYTSKMVSQQIVNMPFLYRAIWIKNVFGNKFMCNKAMVSFYEDICIFQKKHDAEGKNPLREYFKRVLDYTGLQSSKGVNAILGHRHAEHCFYVTGNRNGSTQFSLCTEQTYQELIAVLKIDQMEGFLPYDELKQINKKYESRFNLWQGGKTKSNILEYHKDSGGFHPTQKPVALLEDLIRTFSDKDDNVLDFTMGSGSTGVACANTGRKFIGIELDRGYFEVAQKRVEGAYSRD